ncbi:unnamed protein product [Closterium sp. NIES-65]|nr:unnamed protein product [Closterium sp. NIES-65]
MATEAARSVVDLGHTAESVLAPPPAPAAPAAEAPTAPPVPLAAAAPSTAPVQLASAPPPSLPLPLGAPAPDAPAPVAPQPPVASPLVQAAAGVPAPGTAVGASHDPAHQVALASAPVQPVAQPHAESHSRGVAGGSTAAHRGRGSPRRRPSPLYRNAHRGGRGGWVQAQLLAVHHHPHLVRSPPLRIRLFHGFPPFRTRDLWEREAERRGGPSALCVALMKVRLRPLRQLFPFPLRRG